MRHFYLLDHFLFMPRMLTARPLCTHSGRKTVKALRRIGGSGCGYGRLGSRCDKEVGAYWEECWACDQGGHSTLPRPLSLHPDLTERQSDRAKVAARLGLIQNSKSIT